MSSQINIGAHWSSEEYNGNNAWYFNGTNGTLNNNNKYNSYRVWPSLDFNESYDNSSLSSYPIPLREFYPIYRACRRHKRNKPSQQIFELDLVRNLTRIVHEVNNFEYVPRPGICFIVLVPKQREILAADFADRIVHTLFVSMVHPTIEAVHLHPDSYSCRVGKGALRAINRLQEYIYTESRGYTRDVWVVSVDIDSCFMSIDTALLTQRFVEFIDEHMAGHPHRELLKYLARIIYQSLPQEHCVLKGRPSMWVGLPDRKSLRKTHWSRGVPIGNSPSQEGNNFLASFYLWQLTAMGYKFVHYTDDTAIVVTDLERWKADRVIFGHYVESETHLRLHPCKYYQQHHSKGITSLGYKLRFNRILLSDRTMHNILWRVAVGVKKADTVTGYIYTHKESFMATINSYLGMLKHTNSHNVTQQIIQTLQASDWAKVFDFHPGKVTIKPYATLQAYYHRKNRERKHQTISTSWTL